jgi:hypothetical protein
MAHTEKKDLEKGKKKVASICVLAEGKGRNSNKREKSLFCLLLFHAANSPLSEG